MPAFETINGFFHMCHKHSIKFIIKPIKKFAVAATTLSCIREIPGSNFGWNTDDPGLLWFFLASPGLCLDREIDV